MEILYLVKTLGDGIHTISKTTLIEVPLEAGSTFCKLITKPYFAQKRVCGTLSYFLLPWFYSEL